MDTLIIVIAGAIGLLAAAVVIFWENLLERFIDRFTAATGLSSGEGPLEATATTDAHEILITLENKGEHAMKLAAIEGRNAADQRVFPTPALPGEPAPTPDKQAQARKRFAKVKIPPAGVTEITLKPSELAELGCRSLAVLDHNGTSWPVAGDVAD